MASKTIARSTLIWDLHTRRAVDTVVLGSGHLALGKPVNDPRWMSGLPSLVLDPVSGSITDFIMEPRRVVLKGGAPR